MSNLPVINQPDPVPPAIDPFEQERKRREKIDRQAKWEFRISQLVIVAAMLIGGTFGARYFLIQDRMAEKIEALQPFLGIWGDEEYKVKMEIVEEDASMSIVSLTTANHRDVQIGKVFIDSNGGYTIPCYFPSTSTHSNLYLKKPVNGVMEYHWLSEVSGLGDSHLTQEGFIVHH